jgi:hypothetical protein
MGHASRSSGLLRVKSSRDRVFQSDLRIGRGAAARVVHVTPSWRLR